MLKYLFFSLLITASPVFPQSLFINEVLPWNATGIRDEDNDQPDWIEIYNAGLSSVNLSGFGISDESANKFKWIFPSVTLNPNNFLLLYASGKNHSAAGANLHTNFKLAKDGDTLYFVNPSGQLIDQFIIPSLPVDISVGRKPDGSTSMGYFQQPTPGTPNITQSFAGVAGTPVFSLNGGYHQGSVNLSLAATSAQEKIYYTLDGSEPTENSALYNSPILISELKIVKAKSFGLNLIPGSTVTNTYLVNKSFTLPVISISTNAENLWDEHTGIYVLGDSADSQFPFEGANFWKDWEKPVHVEMYEPDGKLAFSIGAGLSVFGGWSRGYDQKSLSVTARDKYGYENINYKIFHNRKTDKFKSIVLRNGGQDWESAMMRDALMQSLVEDADLDVQAYRPAVVFLNGQYWGIHDIRERVNKDMIEQHHNVSAENIDLLKLDAEIIDGDNAHYLSLLNFLENNDLSLKSSYDYVKTQMDVENFIRYNVAEIYFDNWDWPGSNIEYWRPNTVDGKWKWILYDTDFGFGLYDSTAYTHNSLEAATEPNGPEWPNPAWSTLLLRKLLINNEFKNDFINCFADYSNSYFLEDTVTNKIDIIKNQIEPEIEAHQLRWGRTLSQWQKNVQRIYDFANRRLHYMRVHFLQKFSLPGLSNFSINVSNPAAGSVKINNIKIPSYPWSGNYFSAVPVELTANPKNGYHFVKWSGISSSDSQSIVITLNGNASITAEFELDSNVDGNIVINEINYHSSDDFNPEDWVELYNRSGNTMELSGWIFKDEDDTHSFTFPHNTFLQPGKYLVLCEDDSAFSAMFPSVTNFIGSFDFALDNAGELIRLFDSQMNLVDVVNFDDEAPWPVEPDGNGPTLALVDPLLDNSNPANWRSSSNHGSPGAENDSVTFINVDENNLPKAYKLSQNFPNPFNPSTSITYELPQTSSVQLKIYDMLGREITTLINEEQNAGKYRIIFDGKELSSGIYFYKLTAGSFASIFKMILIK